MNKSVAQFIKHKLKILAVKRTWVVSRATQNVISNAVAKDEYIEWIIVGQNQNATFTCYRSAQLKQAIAVGTATVGFYTLNFINGLDNVKKADCIGDYREGAILNTIANKHWLWLYLLLLTPKYLRHAFTSTKSTLEEAYCLSDPKVKEELLPLHGNKNP